MKETEIVRIEGLLETLKLQLILGHDQGGVSSGNYVLQYRLTKEGDK